MDLTFTLWPNRYSIEGKVVTGSWFQWRDDFAKHQDTDLKKSGLPCAVLGRMIEGDRRTNNNVETIEALALDIEEKESVHPDPYISRLEKALQALAPYEYVAYTTFSHTEQNPRLRVILPLAKPIRPKDYKNAMSYLNALTGSIADPGAQKISQPVYLPLHPAGAPDHWAMAHEGQFLDVTTQHAQDVTEIRSALGEGRGRAPMEAATRFACRAILNGVPFAEKGNRDESLLRVAWHVVNRSQLKQISLDVLETVFHWSLDAMGPDAPTIEDLQSKIERGQEKARVEPQTREGQPYIIQFRDYYYILKPEGGYSRACSAREASGVARKLLRQHQDVELVYFNKTGDRKNIPLPGLVDRYGEFAEEVAIDLKAKESYFEDGNFYEATIKWPTIEPVFHPDIDRWLGMLGGDLLKNWLSIFHDLDRLLSTLVLMGTPNAGKTLLAMGLAARFGSRSPSAQNAVTGKFQDEITHCPLVYIDEEITDHSYDRSFLAAIRNQLSVRERLVHRKYLVPAQMMGAIRCIISANHLPFKEKDSSTGQDLKAIAERFHWVQAGDDAAEYIRSIDPDRLQEWRDFAIAEHVRHLEETRTVDQATDLVCQATARS